MDYSCVLSSIDIVCDVVARREERVIQQAAFLRISDYSLTHKRHLLAMNPFDRLSLWGSLKLGSVVRWSKV